MSRGTNAASPSSGWQWAPTREATPPSGKVNRTALCRAASAALAFCLLVSCGRDSGQQEYDRLVAAYRRGELAPTAAAAAGAAKRFPTDLRRQWQFRLLAAESLTGLARFKEAEAAISPEPPGTLPLERARAWIDRAQIHVRQAEVGAGLLAQARPLATTPELAIRLDLVSGNVEANAGNSVKAEQWYRSALDRALRQKDRYYEANALNNISVMRRRQNHWEESVDYGLRAIAAAESTGALRMAAAAHGTVGTSYAYLGEYESALRHEQKAVTMDRAMGLREAEAIAIGEVALIYDRESRHADAIPQHEAAFRLALDLGMKSDAARFAENLAVSYVSSGQWDRAHDWNERAWDLATQSNAASTLPYLLRNRADIANARGQTAEAAAICRRLLAEYPKEPHIRWEAHHLLASIHSKAGRHAAANRDFEAALGDIDATRSELLAPRYRVTFLSHLIGFYRSYVDALVAQGNDAKAFAVAESSRARVLAERVGRSVEGAPRVADAAALRDFSRASGASILAFWVAQDRSFAWVVTPSALRRVDLPPAAEIESLVTSYRGVVEHSVADPMEDAAGRALWEKVLGPATRGIPPGSPVVVIPDGALHRLNPETVPVPGPRPHYWIEDAEVSVAPSVSLAMAAPSTATAHRSLLLIGAPEYKGSGYRDLPGAAAEVEELRRRFAGAGPAVLTGKSATPVAYRAAGPANYSLIHFAAHAEANSEKPLESAVVLSRAGDGFKLYASDVIDIPIHAELVTLSGCRSAGVRSYAGEGLMGFAWAFLHAGARAVVAGLWDVSDRVTAPLMAHFYDGLLANRPPAAALREAKLRLMQEGRVRPFYWGAFQTYIGAGGSVATASARR